MGLYGLLTGIALPFLAFFYRSIKYHENTFCCSRSVIVGQADRRGDHIFATFRCERAKKYEFKAAQF
jgi:hypothetical protein